MNLSVIAAVGRKQAVYSRLQYTVLQVVAIVPIVDDIPCILVVLSCDTKQASFRYLVNLSCEVAISLLEITGKSCSDPVPAYLTCYI